MQLVLDIEENKKDIVLNIHYEDKEQEEIEKILNSRTIEDKKVSHSKTIFIEI